jgi:hypothetical protein
MSVEERMAVLEKKIDTVLSILGHGRTKSHTEIQREADDTVARIRLRMAKRHRKEAREHDQA